MKINLAAAAIAATMAFGVSGAQAGTVVVNPSPTTFPTTTQWGVLPGENTAGGSAAITTTVARSGNGSVELRGDRSRFQVGNQYAGQLSNLMSLGGVTGLSFDWRVAADSAGGYNVDQTPALRLLVQDGSQRSELVWEGVYNGTYGNTLRDTWYSTDFSNVFYQYVAGSGVTLVNGSQVNKTIAQWISDNYSANAYVTGISVGVGSGFSANYHAFADNVTLGTVNGNTTFNFEATSAVPEPASWAMLLTGFGLTGLAVRRRAAGRAFQAV